MFSICLAFSEIYRFMIVFTRALTGLYPDTDESVLVDVRAGPGLLWLRIEFDLWIIVNTQKQNFVFHKRQGNFCPD
jgi:hypothetical protein